jgi:hypothetical protein
MIKQAIVLFIRALIIGLLLNLGIHYAASLPTPEEQTGAPNQVQHSTKPASTTNSSFSPGSGQ